MLCFIKSNRPMTTFGFDTQETMYVINMIIIDNKSVNHIKHKQVNMYIYMYTFRTLSLINLLINVFHYD